MTTLSAPSLNERIDFVVNGIDGAERFIMDLRAALATCDGMQFVLGWDNGFCVAMDKPHATNALGATVFDTIILPKVFNGRGECAVVWPRETMIEREIASQKSLLVTLRKLHADLMREVEADYHDMVEAHDRAEYDLDRVT